MRWRQKEPRAPSELEQDVLVTTAPTRVLAAFFEPHALEIWWQAVRSVTTPRPLGVYAIEWEPTAGADDLLGRLGGVFHGTIIDYSAGRSFLVADAWWLPPDGDPLGPMSLEVTCTMDGPACRLRIRQSGFGPGPRWQRFYEVISRGWKSALASLKAYVEERALGSSAHGASDAIRPADPE